MLVDGKSYAPTCSGRFLFQSLSLAFSALSEHPGVLECLSAEISCGAYSDVIAGGTVQPVSLRGSLCSVDNLVCAALAGSKQNRTDRIVCATEEHLETGFSVAVFLLAAKFNR